MAPSYHLFLLLTANVSSYIVICMIYMSKFAENANLKVNFYKIINKIDLYG